MSQLHSKYKFSAYKFVIPFLVVFFLVNVLPYLISFYMSFQYWFLLDEFKAENIDFVGLKNYFLIYDESRIKLAFLSVFYYVSFSLVMLHVLSLILAKLISFSFKFTQSIVLLAFIVPFVVPAYAFDDSVIQLDLQLGRPGVFEENLLLISLVDSLIVTYNLLGFFTLIYYMVLKSVSRNVLEAAQLDGASIVRVFYSIELPQMRKMIVMMIILSIVMLIGSARGVNIIINVLWNGGDMGIASAFTWTYIYVLLIIVLVGYLISKRKNKVKGEVK